jgi:hypothetical protein
VNANASTLITHLPDALAHGDELRDRAMVRRVEIDTEAGASRMGWATTTTWSADTSWCRAPRKRAGRFTEEVRMYKAPPPEVSTEAFYETDPHTDRKRGFSIQTVSPMPITWSEHVVAEGHWGAVLREYLRDYVHWCVLGTLCEFLPLPDNRVTLVDEVDAGGLPVARFDYAQCDNDKALLRDARGVMTRILQTAGAEDIVTIERYAHLMGGTRMGTAPENGSSTGTCGPSPCRTCT